MMPRLGAKYDIDIETISKPIAEYQTDEYFELDLPAAPDWFSVPPKGTWEDGYRLSFAALEMIKDRPEIFEQREQRRCRVEFVL